MRMRRILSRVGITWSEETGGRRYILVILSCLPGYSESVQIVHL